MPRRYHILDVFADRPLAGNPLAVVLDADGLDTAAMQAITREFNLSETVFVLPPDEPRHRAKLRIFTPGLELPFAGHPTVGTAALLASLDHEGAEGDFLFGLEEGIGAIPCAVSLKGDGAFARFTAARLPEEAEGPAPDPALAAAALGLDADEVGFENHHPTRYGAGVPFTFVPVRHRDALAAIRLDMARFAEAFGSEGQSAVYVYTRAAADTDAAFHARMFSPHDGIGEDPATGSAAAALAGAVASFDELRAGDTVAWIEQGVEMGRPSRIELTMTVEGVRLAGVAIGGHAVRVAEGVLHV